MSQGKIMLVDDDADIGYIMKSFLEAKKYVVESYSNPILALEQFKASPRDYVLVIADIRMPGMTGIELGNEITKIAPNTKILYMSSFDITPLEFSKIAPSKLKDDFLQKPARLNELYDKVKTQLGDDEGQKQ